MPYTLQFEGVERNLFELPSQSPRKRDYDNDSNKFYVTKNSYTTTRHFHESSKPCMSPYCGVCSDDYIVDFLQEQIISKELGLVRKLCQSSIKRLEDKYGYDAHKIFRNKVAQLQFQQRKRRMEYLIKEGFENCTDPHNEIHNHDLKCLKIKD